MTHDDEIHLYMCCCFVLIVHFWVLYWTSIKVQYSILTLMYHFLFGIHCIIYLYVCVCVFPNLNANWYFWMFAIIFFDFLVDVVLCTLIVSLLMLIFSTMIETIFFINSWQNQTYLSWYTINLADILKKNSSSLFKRL